MCLGSPVPPCAASRPESGERTLGVGAVGLRRSGMTVRFAWPLFRLTYRYVVVGRLVLPRRHGRWTLFTALFLTW
jgi:hypothetical protein